MQKKLIEMLVRKEKHCGGKGGKTQSSSLDQELRNVMLSKIALNLFKGVATRCCQVGNDLDKIYSNHLMIHS